MDKTCVNCKGSGKQIRHAPIMRGMIMTKVMCPYCKGTGKKEEE